MDPTTELYRILGGIDRRLGVRRRQHSSALFRAAVEAWCEALDWPRDVVSHAMALERQHAEHLGRTLFQYESTVRARKKSTSKVAWVADTGKSVGSLVSAGLRSDLNDYIDASDEAMSKMEPKDYLLIALAVAAAGYVIYRLTRPRSQPADTRPARTPEVRADRWTLVLVVNAGRAGVIDGLRAGGVVSLDGDQLYQATQALWFGTATDFEVSALSSWFDEGKGVEETSEYDVHLVKLELDGDDRGLHRNANQMDRLDAFRRVKAKGYKCDVSPRLPSDAYGTTDVYSR